MVTPQLIDYIARQMKRGVPRDVISQALEKAGWLQSDIAEAFNQINSSYDSSDPRMYPWLTAKKNPSPSRFYAFPIIGICFKVIALIPQAIILTFSMLIIGSLVTINSFHVFFNGKYLRTTYDWLSWWMKFNTKFSFYFYGITDKYPGFSANIDDNYTLEIEYPSSSEKFFAVPLIGGVIRFIFMIPYFIYVSIIANVANFAWFFSWGMPLINKKYPETTHELVVDSLRLEYALMMYVSGLSDKYPSFKISKNHLKIKIFLIVLVLMLNIFNFVSGMFNSEKDTIDFGKKGERNYPFKNINSSTPLGEINNSFPR